MFQMEKVGRNCFSGVEYKLFRANDFDKLLQRISFMSLYVKLSWGLKILFLCNQQKMKFINTNYCRTWHKNDDGTTSENKLGYQVMIWKEFYFCLAKSLAVHLQIGEELNWLVMLEKLGNKIQEAKDLLQSQKFTVLKYWTKRTFYRNM